MQSINRKSGYLFWASLFFDFLAIASLVSMSLIWNRMEGIFALSVLLPLSWRLKGFDFGALIFRHGVSLMAVGAFVLYFWFFTFIASPVTEIEVTIIDKQQSYLLGLTMTYFISFLSFQASQTIGLIVRFFLPTLLVLASFLIIGWSFHSGGCRTAMFFSSSPYTPPFIFCALSLMTLVNWQYYSRTERLVRYYLLFMAVFLPAGPFGSRGVLIALILVISLLTILAAWKRNESVPNGMKLIFFTAASLLSAGVYIRYISNCGSMLIRYDDYFLVVVEHGPKIASLLVAAAMIGWILMKTKDYKSPEFTLQFLVLTLYMTLMVGLFCAPFLNLFENDTANVFKDSSNSQRMTMWAGGLYALKNNIVFGLGSLGENAILHSQALMGNLAGKYGSVHSQTMTFIIAGGLVGVSLFFFAMTIPFLTTRDGISVDYTLAFIGGPVFFLLATSTETITGRPSIFYMIFVIIILSVRIIDKRSES